MRLLATGSQNSPAWNIRFAPSGRHFATLTAGRAEACLWRWDGTDRLELAARIQVGTRPFLDLAFNPSGEYLALVGLSRGIEIVSVRDGKRIRTLGEPIPENETERSEWGFTGIAFSPDGKYLLGSATWGSYTDGTKIYDFSTGDIIDVFWASEKCISFYPEGRLFAAPYYGQMSSEIHFGTLAERCQGYSIKVRCDEVMGLVFSPRGDALASIGGLEDAGYSDYRLDIYRFPELMLQAQQIIRMPDVKEFMKRHPYGFDYQGQESPRANRVVFSPDGNMVLSPRPTGDLVETDISSGEEGRRWRAHDELFFAIDADFELGVMVTADLNGSVKIWKLPYETKPVLIPGLCARFLRAARPVPYDMPWYDMFSTNGRSSWLKGP
jgi:WD40 repeat protein